MNKRDFYKELMSEYMFDKEKICANAKKGKLTGRRSLPIYMGMTAAVAAAVVVVGTTVFTSFENNGGVHITSDPTIGALSTKERLDRVISEIEKNQNSEERIDVFVTFANQLSPKETQSLLLLFSEGSVPVKMLYMADCSRAIGTNAVGEVFKNNSGDMDITAAVISCPGYKLAEINANELVFAAEPMSEEDSLTELAPLETDVTPPDISMPSVESSKPSPEQPENNNKDNNKDNNHSHSSSSSTSSAPVYEPPEIDDPIDNPVLPNHPNNPSEPTNPNQPNTPSSSEPGHPNDPNNPGTSDPTNPNNPNQPTDPNNPGTSDPGEPNQPNDPGTSDPVEPNNPDDPGTSDPDEPNQPNDPGTSDPVEPNEPNQPNDPGTSDPIQPVDPNDPGTGEPNDPGTDPSYPLNPTDPNEPGIDLPPNNPPPSSTDPGVTIPNPPSDPLYPQNPDKQTFTTENIGAQKAYFLSENVFYVKSENAVALYKWDGSKETLAAYQTVSDARVVWVSENGGRLMVSGVEDGVRKKLFIIDAQNCTVNEIQVDRMVGEGSIAEAAYNESLDVFALNVVDSDIRYIYMAKLSGYQPLDPEIIAFGSTSLSLLAAYDNAVYYSETYGNTTSVFKYKNYENLDVTTLDSIYASVPNSAFTHSVMFGENGISVFDPATERFIPITSGQASFGASTHSFFDGNSYFTIRAGEIIPETETSVISKIDFTRSFSSKWSAAAVDGAVKIVRSENIGAGEKDNEAFAAPEDTTTTEQSKDTVPLIEEHRYHGRRPYA